MTCSVQRKSALAVLTPFTGVVVAKWLSGVRTNLLLPSSVWCVHISASSYISPPFLLSIGTLKPSYFLYVTPSFSGENSFPCVLQQCWDPEDGDIKLLRNAGNDLALDTISYGGRLVSTFCFCPHPVITRYHHHHHHHPCCHLYAVYLQIYTWNKPRFYAIQCCSCSVVTVCATCNVISPMTYGLFFYISTSHSLCAVHNMAVFCSSLISRFPGVLLRYCVCYFAMVPVAPVITGISCAATCHMCWISVMKYLGFKVISASFLITFLSQGIATIIIIIIIIR